MAVFDFPRRISASSKVNVERPSATSSFASAKPRCGEEKYIICGLRELKAFIHNPVGVRETHVFSELSPWLRGSCPAGAARTGGFDMRIEVAKEANVSSEVVIRDEDQSLALRMTLGPDGIERIVHERSRSATELSADIAAAIRALSSTLEHILTTSVRDG